MEFKELKKIQYGIINRFINLPKEWQEKCADEFSDLSNAINQCYDEDEDKEI